MTVAPRSKAVKAPSAIDPPVAVPPDLQLRHLRSTWGTFACEATDLCERASGTTTRESPSGTTPAIRVRYMVAQAVKVRLGLKAPPKRAAPATHPALTGAPDSMPSTEASASTTSMINGDSTAWARLDSNQRPLASEANALSN